MSKTILQYSQLLWNMRTDEPGGIDIELPRDVSISASRIGDMKYVVTIRTPSHPSKFYVIADEDTFVYAVYVNLLDRLFHYASYLKEVKDA